MGKWGGKKYWAGLVNDEIHFYRAKSYYDSVRHADLFSSKREAEKCYEAVVRITIECLPKPKRKGASR